MALDFSKAKTEDIILIRDRVIAALPKASDPAQIAEYQAYIAAANSELSRRRFKTVLVAGGLFFLVVTFTRRRRK